MTAFANPTVAGVGQNSGSFLLFQFTVPVGIACTGTVGANGALTLGTALISTYNIGLYLYFPAGAVFSGSAAGFYFCTMSSTTAGTIFNNVMGALPVVPTSPIAVVDAGPGAYTGVTSAIDAVTYSIPGKSIGKNGSLIYNYETSNNNSVNNKSYTTLLGGTIFIGATRTTSTHENFTSRMRNIGSESRQSLFAATESSTSTSTVFVNGSVDTTAAQNFVMRCQLANATDNMLFLSAVLELIPGA